MGHFCQFNYDVTAAHGGFIQGCTSVLAKVAAAGATSPQLGRKLLHCGIGDKWKRRRGKHFRLKI